MSLCSNLPSNVLVLISTMAPKSAKQSTSKVFLVPWEREQSGRKRPREQRKQRKGSRGKKGQFLLLKLTWADSGLGNIQDLNQCIIPWASTFPAQVGELIVPVVFNIHPSPHWEMSNIRPIQSQPTMAFLVAGIIQGWSFHLVQTSGLWKSPQCFRALETSGPTRDSHSNKDLGAFDGVFG